MKVFELTVLFALLHRSKAVPVEVKSKYEEVFVHMFNSKRASKYLAHCFKKFDLDC